MQSHSSNKAGFVSSGPLKSNRVHVHVLQKARPKGHQHKVYQFCGTPPQVPFMLSHAFAMIAVFNYVWDIHASCASPQHVTGLHSQALSRKVHTPGLSIKEQYLVGQHEQGVLLVWDRSPQYAVIRAWCFTWSRHVKWFPKLPGVQGFC